MRPTPSHNLRAFLLGAARLSVVAALTALACLSWASRTDAKTLSLSRFHELTQSESVLMSCADALPLSSGAEVEWCADPSSPACRPVAPPSHRVDLGDAARFSLLSSLEVPAATFVWMCDVEWPRPEASPLLFRSDRDRLDRPPRA